MKSQVTPCSAPRMICFTPPMKKQSIGYSCRLFFSLNSCSTKASTMANTASPFNILAAAAYSGTIFRHGGHQIMLKNTTTYLFFARKSLKFFPLKITTSSEYSVGNAASSCWLHDILLKLPSRKNRSKSVSFRWLSDLMKVVRVSLKWWWWLLLLVWLSLWSASDKAGLKKRRIESKIRRRVVSCAKDIDD